MKNLKLLNKKYLSIILFCLLIGFSVQSEEVVDIWNIEDKKSTKKNIKDKDKEKKVFQKIAFLKCRQRKIIK